MKISLDEKYRPKAFADFVGLPDAKQILSRLARRGIRRNILLWGALGSGKTSIARVYAAALHCSSRLADGSPCWTCAPCRDQEYLLEYDTPLDGGDVKSIAAYLNKVDAIADRQSVFAFLDEAHALSPHATDLFLKRLERDDNVVYAFATTAPETFSKQFLSRLTKIEVRALSHASAISFLRDIADREKIPSTPDGLSLLAAIERGYPRAMLQTLGTLALTGQPVDVDAMKEHFGRDNIECIYSYMGALADGDPQGQISAMEVWPGPLEHKVERVIRLLTSMYYNNILGVDVVACPLSYAMRVQREDIASRFCARWGLSQCLELAPNWIRMLEYWVQYSTTPQTLSLRLFEDLVNRGLAGLPKMGGERETVRRPAAPIEGTIDNGHDDRFFEYRDAREIINRSSFFIQETGFCLNAAFVISPLHLATEEEVRAAAKEFQYGLEGRFGGAPFDLIVLHEREATPLARILGHIPDLNREHGLLERLCETIEDKLHCMIELSYKSAELSTKYAIKFHWQETLRLCEGLPDRYAANEDNHAAGLRSLVRRSRKTGVVRPPLLEFSGRLSRDQPLGDHGLEFLSALDAGAWKALRSGWELSEHRHRIGQLELRNEQLNIADAMSLGPFDREQRLAELHQDWSHEMKSHKARWIRKWQVGRYE